MPTAAPTRHTGGEAARSRTDGPSATPSASSTRPVEALQAFDVGGRGTVTVTVTDDCLRALARAYKACGPTQTTTSVKMLAEATGRNGNAVMNHLTKAHKLGMLD